MHLSAPAQYLLPLEEPGSRRPDEDFQNVIERAIEFGKQKFPLTRPLLIQWKAMPVTAGRAQMDDGVIVLSKKLLTSETRVWETFLHEYAHLVVYEAHGHRARPHGREWQRVMMKLGLKPEVTHDYECERRSVAKPFVCICTKCGDTFARARRFKRGRIYHHIGCGGRVKMETVSR